MQASLAEDSSTDIHSTTSNLISLGEPLQAGGDDISLIRDVFRLVRESRFDAALNLLDECPAIWSSTDADGHTLLHWSALLGHEDFVQRALRHKCEVDAPAANKQTPLMWALVRGHLAATRVLIEAKADVRSVDSVGATPLVIAVQHTHHQRYQLMLVILQHGTSELFEDVDCKGCNVVHWAAYKGDLTALKLLADFKADLCVQDFTSMSPLHRAVYGNQPHVISFLLENRLDPWQRNSEGQTCFDMANNNLVIKDLLRGGTVGSTPQDTGSRSSTERKGTTDIVETLLKDSSAEWLVPYYHSFLEAVGQETMQPAQDLEPLIPESSQAQPIGVQLFGEFGDDGL